MLPVLQARNTLDLSLAMGLTAQGFKQGESRRLSNELRRKARFVRKTKGYQKRPGNVSGIRTRGRSQAEVQEALRAESGMLGEIKFEVVKAKTEDGQ